MPSISIKLHVVDRIRAWQNNLMVPMWRFSWSVPIEFKTFWRYIPGWVEVHNRILQRDQQIREWSAQMRSECQSWGLSQSTNDIQNRETNPVSPGLQQRQPKEPILMTCGWSLKMKQPSDASDGPVPSTCTNLLQVDKYPANVILMLCLAIKVLSFLSFCTFKESKVK